MRSSPSRRAVALAAIAATLLTGCGDDGDGGSATTTAERDAAERPATGRGGVRLVEVGEFAAPVYVTQPSGGEGDLYVVEKGGRIIRVADGAADEQPFLDISDEVSTGGEQGLLSMAFGPDFARSGRFYIDYTDVRGDTRIEEIRARGDPPRADLATRRELLRIDQPFENHNGGLILFGPDELLYIGTGDGGSAGDPMRNALDLRSPLGKILRIDPRPEGGAGGSPYRIPASNPFVDQPGARGEVYSSGLRNPWRFSFDRRTGWLSIGDVGQDSVEEVDLVGRGEGRGADFGWSAFEGDEPFNPDQEAPDAISPVLTYPLDSACAVTGGYVVRDRSLSSLYGRYLYGDFCEGELRSFTAAPEQQASDDRALGLEVPQLSSFGEDGRGRVYAVSLDGPVYRVAPRP